MKMTASAKCFVAVGMLCLLSACAKFKTQNYQPPVWAPLTDEYLETFIGRPIRDAQRIFGYNFSAHILADRKTSYSWEMNNDTGFGLIWAGTTKTIPCSWSFVTDPRGIILHPQRIGYCDYSLMVQ